MRSSNNTRRRKYFKTASRSSTTHGIPLSDRLLRTCILSTVVHSATAEELQKEYKACESPDYITYVTIICWLT